MHCTKIWPEFEFKGQRSNVKVTDDKKNEKLLSHPHWQCIVRRAPYAVRCKWRHRAADDTTPSPTWGDGWRQCTLTAGCVRFMFGKTSLALVLDEFYSVTAIRDDTSFRHNLGCVLSLLTVTICKICWHTTISRSTCTVDCYLPGSDVRFSKLNRSVTTANHQWSQWS